ncbi:MAG: hypothetical protein RL264_2512 [Bacteroidota bacterium]
MILNKVRNKPPNYLRQANIRSLLKTELWMECYLIVPKNLQFRVMKNVLFILFILFGNLSISQTASIYRINFRIEPELVNEFGVRVGNASTVNSNSLFHVLFPNSIIDSLKTVIERTVSKELNAIAQCVYRKNRKGNNKTSIAINNQLGGMPENFKKWAIRSVESDYYVRVQINYIARGGLSFSLFDGQLSSLRPMVIMKIVAFDGEKRRVYRRKVRVKNFQRLRAVQITRSNVSVRQSEVLSPQDIYQMLLQTAEAFELK